jgi:YggT family protein
MRTFLVGVDAAIEIYCWILFALAALQLLAGFKFINPRDGAAATVKALLERATSLPLRLVRTVMPDLGAIDFSPIALIMILMALRYALALSVWPRYF